MSLLVEPYVSSQNYFDKKQIEQIILKLADAFDIRVSWNWDKALLTGSFALLGGALGGYATGRIGAAVGGAIGGAVGYGVSTMVSLREIWDYVKEKLEGLLYVVFNYLRRLDPKDYVNAARVLMACASNKRELVMTILDFLAHELGRECRSSLTAA